MDKQYNTSMYSAFDPFLMGNAAEIAARAADDFARRAYESAGIAYSAAKKDDKDPFLEKWQGVKPEKLKREDVEKFIRENPDKVSPWMKKFLRGIQKKQKK